MFYHIVTFIRYIDVNCTFALVVCVLYNEDFVKTRFCPFYCNFSRAEENRSLRRELCYIELR